MSKDQNNILPFSLPIQAGSDAIDPAELLEDAGQLVDRLTGITTGRLDRLKENLEQRTETLKDTLENDIAGNFDGSTLFDDFQKYLVDLYQRQVIFTDTLRQRGNNYVEHVEAGQPPLLAFDYEVILDGRDLDRPTNYSLVHIKPGKEAPETKMDQRPYIIIDPRAGHGSGIGGFKNESEVGCALQEGHPVYFVIFSPNPIEGQTIGDVTNAEACFVREVRRRHKDAPHPIVIGNCQGGWAAMLLAATNPDITGPVVANGAPLSYWAGEVGSHTMRYLGGTSGGIVPIMMMADLTGGLFDGAHLVENFESMNPSNTYWSKNYHAFTGGDKEAPRYLEFERWWSGFYLMNEEEIRWILENLFVGNKLARGQAFLDEQTHVDLRNIRSPIIIFASHGDNITPPQQALYWIADNYKNVEEIKARGQRIVYTLHEDIGHLGIFVSSKIAAKQHKEIVSTLKTIESMAPGLYEMVITKVSGEGLNKEYTVQFEERQVDDILSLGDAKREDEKAFAAVARMSLLNAEIYDTYMRPFVKAMVNPQLAQKQIELHPLRLRRLAVSDKNPLLGGLGDLAENVRQNRKSVNENNIFMQMEKIGSSMIETWWDTVRDMKAMTTEATFYALWGSPFMQQYGQTHANRVSDGPHNDLTTLPEVQHVLDRLDKGGFPDAVLRMLIFLASSRGAVRRDRLEKSNQMMETTAPFDAMKPKHRTRMIHEQSIAAAFAPEESLSTLSDLLKTEEERNRALHLCTEIAGDADEMTDATKEMFAKFAHILNVANPLDDGSKPSRKTTTSKTPTKAAE